MPIWKRNTTSPPTNAAEATPVEQAVLIRITSLRDPGAGLDSIADPIITAVDGSGTGEFDGNEIGPEGATLYMYGPDADAIWAVVEGVVDRTALGPGSHAVIRNGPPGSPSRRIDLA